MKSWIEKTVNPPGINKPGKGALFSAIGGVFERVRRDALKAFNAHFPYLADSGKLLEHGNALLIPRLSDDTEAEYRDRVATASFFLAKAGERAYITGQLDAHFGDRYAVLDEFLDVYVKVRDLAEADRKWLLQFLDGLINPNVKLTVAEWFHFFDRVIAHEHLAMLAETNLRDTFNDRSVKLNGRVKLDGQTKNETVKLRPKLDGRFSLDGGINLSGALLSLPATGTMRVPVRLGRGILDLNRITVKPTYRDKYAARIKLNGALKLNGAERLSGYGRVNDRLAMRSQITVLSPFSGVAETARVKAKTSPADCYTVPFKLNGASRLDGSAKLNGKRGVLAKFTMAMRTGYHDTCTAGDHLNVGMRYCHKLDGRCRLDGSIKLNSGVLLAA